jgi:hypothetical protein
MGDVAIPQEEQAAARGAAGIDRQIAEADAARVAQEVGRRRSDPALVRELHDHHDPVAPGRDARELRKRGAACGHDRTAAALRHPHVAVEVDSDRARAGGEQLLERAREHTVAQRMAEAADVLSRMRSA